MPRYLRVSLNATAVVVVLALLFGVFASLYVRSAIKEGALDKPFQGCLTLRDKAKLDAGRNQDLADWWFRTNIQFYQSGGGTSLNWHGHGLLTVVGLALTTSPEERVRIAYPAMQRLRLCGASFREQQAPSPRPSVPHT